MSPTIDTETFKHEELPDASTYIRLLYIVGVDQTRDIPVHCELTTWPKAVAPEYTAISYTWGDPSLLTVILINGKRMSVRRNCEDVLRQPCRNKGGFFWIDAICINQADNHEKSFQVAKMGDIFRDARQTLACVGRHGNDSEFLFEMMRKHQGQLERRSDSFFLRILRYYLLRKSRLKSTLARLHAALSTFFERSYFQRVWIYQELFFGQYIQICCENDTFDLSSLWELYQALIRMTFNVKTMPLPLLWSGLHDRRNIRFLLEAGVAQNTGITQETRVPLWDMLHVIHDLQSEDPRDRVFGTLAMIDWVDRKPIQPDYAKDPFDLVLEVLQVIEIKPRPTVGDTGWCLTDAAMIANLMGLRDQTSSRLAGEIQTRRLKHFKIPHVNSINMVRKVNMLPTKFLGCRIYCYKAGWHIQTHRSEDAAGRTAFTPRRRKNLLNGVYSPTVQKWSKETGWDVQNTDVLLPDEVHPQDWLLIPSQVRWMNGGVYASALVARGICDSQLQLVGKALVAAGRDWLPPMWPGKNKCPKFRVYLDSEDAIMLAHSCDWTGRRDYASVCYREWEALLLSDENEPRKLQVDGYFQTSICGEGSQSYARRMVSESRWPYP